MFLARELARFRTTSELQEAVRRFAGDSCRRATCRAEDNCAGQSMGFDEGPAAPRNLGSTSGFSEARGVHDRARRRGLPPSASALTILPDHSGSPPCGVRHFQPSSITKSDLAHAADKRAFEGRWSCGRWAPQAAPSISPKALRVSAGPARWIERRRRSNLKEQGRRRRGGGRYDSRARLCLTLRLASSRRELRFCAFCRHA
jgi:hypothetical protein